MDVSYETIRCWTTKLGPQIARNLKRLRLGPFLEMSAPEPIGPTILSRYRGHLTPRRPWEGPRPGRDQVYAVRIFARSRLRIEWKVVFIQAATLDLSHWR